MKDYIRQAIKDKIDKRARNITYGKYGTNTYTNRFEIKPSKLDGMSAEIRITNEFARHPNCNADIKFDTTLTNIDTFDTAISKACMDMMLETIKIEEEKKMRNCRIDNVIFNPPATIVFWKDGTKTVVKCQEGDEFDPEKGIAIAYFKKLHGNTGAYNNILKKWIGDYQMSQYKQDDEAYEDIFNSLLSVIALGVSKNNKGYTEKSFEAFENPVIREALINGVINFDMLKKISYEKSSDLSKVEVLYKDGTKAVFDFSKTRSDDE